jgi:hypothetical protein
MTVPKKTSRTESIAGVTWYAVGLAVCFAMGGCNETPQDGRAWRAVAGVSPFSKLDSLSLPAELDVIGRQRPHAFRTDFGLEERIQGVHVRFFGDRTDESSGPVPHDARVRLVEATWFPRTDDSATVIWNQLIADVSGKVGGPPMCSTAVGTYYRIRNARWSVGGGTVFLRQQYADSVTTDGYRLPVGPSIGIGVALDSTITSRMLSQRRDEECGAQTGNP